MRVGFLVAVLCAAAAGCKWPVHRDNSTLVLVPGHGIIGVLDLSMMPREIARQTGDYRMNALVNFKAWNCEVPSLGAGWSQETKEQPPPWISFCVVSAVISPEETAGSLSRFRGTLQGGGISFANDGGVTRDDVIRQFGLPRHTLRESTFLPKHAGILRAMATSGEPYSLQNPDVGSETMIYPTQGVWFGLHSNVVEIVRVFRPTTQQTRGSDSMLPRSDPAVPP